MRTVSVLTCAKRTIRLRFRVLTDGGPDLLSRSERPAGPVVVMAPCSRLLSVSGAGSHRHKKVPGKKRKKKKKKEKKKKKRKEKNNEELYVNVF